MGRETLANLPAILPPGYRLSAEIAFVATRDPCVGRLQGKSETTYNVAAWRDAQRPTSPVR